MSDHNSSVKRKRHTIKRRGFKIAIREHSLGERDLNTEWVKYGSWSGPGLRHSVLSILILVRHGTILRMY